MKHLKKWEQYTYTTGGINSHEEDNPLNEAFENKISSMLGGLKDLYIVSPGKGQVAVAKGFMWLNNLITNKNKGVFSIVSKTLKDIEMIIERLKGRGVNRVQRLVIGSHGDGQALLIDSKNNKANAQFLSQLKPLLSSDAIVYFTACRGAENLEILQEAANQIERPVYANTQTNYFGLAGQGDFYMCKPGNADLTKYNNPKEGLIKLGLCKKCDKPPIWWVAKKGSVVDGLFKGGQRLLTRLKAYVQKGKKSPNLS